MWEAAFRAPRRRSVWDYVRAAIVTAVVPTASAALLLWLHPSGCDLRGDPSVYRWACLLPGLLTVVPIGVAVLAPIVLILNQRLVHPLPDGWLVVVAATGALTQIMLYGGYLLALDTAYRGQFLDELLLIPQPFIAGAISGTVLWVSLHWKVGRL